MRSSRGTEPMGGVRRSRRAGGREEGARKPTEGEQDREHRDRNTQRAINHTRVKIDIGIELSLDEVLIPQGDFFQLLRDFEKRVI